MPKEKLFKRDPADHHLFAQKEVVGRRSPLTPASHRFLHQVDVNSLHSLIHKEETQARGSGLAQVTNGFKIL